MGDVSALGVNTFAFEKASRGLFVECFVNCVLVFYSRETTTVERFHQVVVTLLSLQGKRCTLQSSFGTAICKTMDSMSVVIGI